MRRQTVLLSVLAAVLVVAMYWMLMFKPQREEQAALEEQIVAQQDRQLQLQLELERYRAVRDRAPELEAELAAASAVVPGNASLPAAIAQVQRAAEDARVTVHAVSTSRPSPLPDSQEELTAIDLTATVEGSYFQLVDFFRRIEDPTITPRGLQWTSVTVAEDEYPILTVNLGGTLYTRAPSLPAPAAPAEDPDAADPDAEGDGQPQDDDETVGVEAMGGE
jgi:Tfp pilus assembly protein PilO